ncbi:MAG: hypothetical protein JSW10_04400 [Pseudomonadota bacterium]|nr:MAG: hypothetical protein JSW10_04400 [Pseudomonadota bacterium]
MLCAAVLAAGGLISTDASVQADAGLTDPSYRATPQAVARTHATIKRKLAFYNRSFPSIRFMHLEGGEEWSGELVALLTLLGVDAVPLDYEHPPDMRTTLLEVTIERLRQMLEYDIMSATLFGVTPDGVVDRPHLCVITLNPATFLADDLLATRYMLDLSDEVARRIHPARYLHSEDLLEFALDHEAFHCLDSRFHGGAPMTQEQFGGEYHLFRRESAADAYALAMHLHAHGEITAFARNLVHVRALWMFTDSPNRCTYETVRVLLKHDPKRLARMSLREVIDLTVSVRDASVRPYHEYLHQRAAALKAARKLGMDPQIYGEQWCQCEKIETQPELVDALVNRYRYYYRQLFTDAPLALEAPSLSGALPQQ